MKNLLSIENLLGAILFVSNALAVPDRFSRLKPGATDDFHAPILKCFYQRHSDIVVGFLNDLLAPLQNSHLASERAVEVRKFQSNRTASQNSDGTRKAVCVQSNVAMQKTDSIETRHLEAIENRAGRN